MDMTEQDRIRDDRLRWHCRRALLELDIVFARFWTAQAGQALSDIEARAMERLLALEDHPLWDLVSGRSEVSGMNEGETMLLERLRGL